MLPHRPGMTADGASPSPLVGEGGCDAKHRRRVRGLSPRIETPHPARSGAQVRSKARHLLPQGEKGKISPGHDVSCGYCVLATRGGVAWVMNWVASSIAGPSGVGIFIQNGTRMRVPATGAKAISMWRWADRYLITARSGI